MSWAVEVQHASDHDLDGQWYEVDRCETEEAAQRSMRYMTRARKTSYHGRPARVREVEGGLPATPAAQRAPSNWERKVAKATRYLRR